MSSVAELQRELTGGCVDVSTNGILELAQGQLTLALDPENGGAVSGFELRDSQEAVPLFRRAATRSVFDSACFPLVPFANRVRDGVFHFRGRTIWLPPNVPGQRHPLHGQGWLSRWNVTDHGGDYAELRFHHASGDWPWAYEARQRFTLAGDSLEIALSCRNTGNEDMPCGLGVHPYFPCGPQTVFTAGVAEVWTVDDQTLPVARVPATGRYDIARRAICGAGLDNLYEHWSGRAVIAWPDRGLRLTMESRVSRLQMYAPRDPFFAAEPVTHAVAALNAPESEWAALGLRVLHPAESMTLIVRFAIEPSA